MHAVLVAKRQHGQWENRNIKKWDTDMHTQSPTYTCAHTHAHTDTLILTCMHTCIHTLLTKKHICVKSIFPNIQFTLPFFKAVH